MKSLTKNLLKSGLVSGVVVASLVGSALPVHAWGATTWERRPSGCYQHAGSFTGNSWKTGSSSSDYIYAETSETGNWCPEGAPNVGVSVQWENSGSGGYWIYPSSPRYAQDYVIVGYRPGTYIRGGGGVHSFGNQYGSTVS